MSVVGSECWWWTGAISGRGHGRFYFALGRVVFAHRFALVLVYGVETLERVRVLGHRCDNPLCQRSTLDTWWPRHMETGVSRRCAGS